MVCEDKIARELETSNNLGEELIARVNETRDTATMEVSNEEMVQPNR
ncbi:hypothetical protein [Alkalibaculum sporogenes]|nr:hypothetical protein [Alkalibaculum sporogenes]